MYNGIVKVCSVRRSTTQRVEPQTMCESIACGITRSLQVMAVLEETAGDVWRVCDASLVDGPVFVKRLFQEMKDRPYMRLATTNDFYRGV